jgi:hypothetical protein
MIRKTDVEMSNEIIGSKFEFVVRGKCKVSKVGSITHKLLEQVPASGVMEIGVKGVELEWASEAEELKLVEDGVKTESV